MVNDDDMNKHNINNNNCRNVSVKYECVLY